MDLRQYGYLEKLESCIAVTLSRFPDLIICNSHAGRAFHQRQGYRSKRIVVIPNGVDVQQFCPNAGARREVREQWGIAPGEVVIGLVARLDPMKDHATFLRAAATVAGLRRNVRFVCVGDGPSHYRDRLIEEAHRLGLDEQLIWAGAQSDMNRIYNALDFSVSSSAFGEGFPNAIAEAMATGVPCVVTDVGDSAAIVGDLGWVCAPADSAALGAAIIAGVDAMPHDCAAIRSHVVRCYSVSALLARSLAQLGPLVTRASITPDSFGWRLK
jgi:glycosyltransferase involved in cell wall biosynthesis